MANDGGLRKLVRKHLAELHWQAVETGGVGTGIPDDNFCGEGIEGWVEHKTTAGFVVGLRPEQVGWIERRRRAGGRVFIDVRRTHGGGPRFGAPVDEYYLFSGNDVRLLAQPKALQTVKPLVHCSGNPASWDWPKIRSTLLLFDFSFSSGSV